jgi:hypothetical protein
MIDTIRSEFLKLRTTRTAGGLAAGLLALTGLAIWGSVANASPAKLAMGLSSTELLIPLLLVFPVFVLILGIRLFTDEFRHGSVGRRSSPRRSVAGCSSRSSSSSRGPHRCSPSRARSGPGPRWRSWRRRGSPRPWPGALIAILAAKMLPLTAPGRRSASRSAP